jgi:glycosyltransferase involved in cell wall biosynthesis
MNSDFSVLIPARGECPFLAQTLESICLSTIQPIEVILVNDGIDPSTLSEISGFQKKMQLTILPNCGQGLVSGLNTGLWHCKTDLIARLDADDLATPSRFELQLNTMENMPQVVLLGGQATYIDSDGHSIGASNYKTGRLDLDPRFLTECMVAHPAVMMRTALARSIGGYRSLCTDGRIDLAEDFDLWIRLMNLGEVYNLSQSIILYRQHANQISSLHISTQSFATKYVSLVHVAEITNTKFEFRQLKLAKWSSQFLKVSFGDLAGIITFRRRFALIIEGLPIFFGLRYGLILRILRKSARLIASN